MPAFSPPPPAPPRRPRCQASNLSRRAVLPLLTLPLTLLPSASGATTTTPYDAYAPSYDSLDGSTPLTRILGFDALRSALLSHASGDVLELGIGTAQNLVHYPTTITSLTGVDTSSAMLRIAEARGVRARFPVSLLRRSADATELPSGRFDTVVDAFSLCVYERPREALREMRRLVKPGGTVLLLEHSAGGGVLRAYQDLTAGAVKRLSKGCVPNQRVREMVTEVGFRVVEETRILGGSVVALRLV